MVNTPLVLSLSFFLSLSFSRFLSESYGKGRQAGPTKHTHMNATEDHSSEYTKPAWQGEALIRGAHWTRVGCVREG